jgi:hypothetical protein
MPKYGRYAQQNNDSPEYQIQGTNPQNVDESSTTENTRGPITENLKARILLRPKRNNRGRLTYGVIDSLVNVLLISSIFISSISLTGMFLMSYRVHRTIEETYQLDSTTAKRMNAIIDKLEGQIKELDTTNKVNPKK